MDDDLGTPQAVAVIFETLRRANAALDRGADDAPALAATVINLAGALGVAVDAAGRGADAGDAAIEDLVARRQAASRGQGLGHGRRSARRAVGAGCGGGGHPGRPIWHRA